MVTVKMNTTLLDNLIRALKGNPPQIRVGILGAKAERTDDNGVTGNAEIGAAHEFGNSIVPMRSFLRVPLIDHMQKQMLAKGMDKEALKKVLATGNITPWCKRIAVIAEGIVLEGFNTGGYGKWPPSDMSRKKNEQTLVETQQLRNSITSEVKT